MKKIIDVISWISAISSVTIVSVFSIISGIYVSTMITDFLGIDGILRAIIYLPAILVVALPITLFFCLGFTKFDRY